MVEMFTELLSLISGTGGLHPALFPGASISRDASKHIFVANESTQLLSQGFL
jgi:hypothetical protein